MIRAGTIKLPFTFAVGKAASAVLSALEEKQEILGSHCKKCDSVLAPARSFCPTCGTTELTNWVLPTKGVLQAWTEVPGRGAFGLILLDGADTAIPHHVLTPPEHLKHGTRVIARFGLNAKDSSKAELLGFKISEVTE